MDKLTIQKMTDAKRYPIPEELMSKPRLFWLKIDSVMHSIYSVDALMHTA